jgi:REP element-mobilizing transposase RayT
MPQSLCSVLVHLIFSTKHRQPLITAELEQELYPYMATVLRECDSPALIINGTVDHVHILLSLARTQTIADVVEEVKKRSSKWAKSKGNEFAEFQWQAGYGAFSIGESMVEAVRRYISKQKEHHRRQSYQDEFREFLAKYRIEYDERYVWD